MDKVTIMDVANEVGVSKTTISRYLNGHFDRINAHTREKIKQAIDEMGYVPNQQARTLKAKHSHLIGLVVADMANLYSSFLIRGIQNVLREHDYSLLIVDSANSLTNEKKALTQLMASNVDGIILQPLSVNSQDYQFLVESNTNVVLVDRQTRPTVWSSVTADNFSASREMALALAKQKYQRIIFISLASDSSTTHALRYEGLQKVAQQKSILLDALEVTDNDLTDLDRLLKATPHTKTALFAVNGQLLIACLQWLQEHHYVIPNDIGITGYDDSELGAVLSPGISTIDQNPQEIGQATARLLFEYIGGKRGHEDAEVASKLTLRHSF
ncbi:LacI family DNA-binding transcriptional regulator [Weissella halotolerans]|uniref:HTH lacI-type domain-containing protein n=1 Tax=Weissella halotolerans DSM 20190 TaxID=1123500 RepID=A0A0R2G6R9_9LACO|nr:LacI family DNA-binding transcriptional regulator [Weissella halotolerans]KRN32420.1 hypothetical protein IV68_GL000772 [Weissella halotolerans DSM 20190]